MMVRERAGNHLLPSKPRVHELDLKIAPRAPYRVLARRVRLDGVQCIRHPLFGVCRWVIVLGGVGLGDRVSGVAV